MESAHTRFIGRNACLTYWGLWSAYEELNGSGAFLTVDQQRFHDAQTAVNALPAFDDDSNRLIAVVKSAFKLMDEKRGSWEDAPDVNEVVAASTWIHERFVRRYFIEIADAFTSNPYYHGEGPT